MEQTYPGKQDAERHFQTLLPAFRDERYVTVEGKPLFLVYSPKELPDPIGFTRLWRDLAIRAGLAGIYFVGVDNEPWIPSNHGFDGATVRCTHLAQNSEAGKWNSRLKRHLRRLLRRPSRVFSYRRAIRHFVLAECEKRNVYPCAIPNWDNTPRSGLRGLVLHGSTPELFRCHLRDLLQQIRPKPAEHQILFVKSWNEWAEGNHLEPDLRFGLGYLEVLREELRIFGVQDHLTPHHSVRMDWLPFNDSSKQCGS
jgi:hypothetical protein